jgi:hypothetical protein
MRATSALQPNYYAKRFLSLVLYGNKRRLDDRTIPAGIPRAFHSNGNQRWPAWRNEITKVGNFHKRISALNVAGERSRGKMENRDIRSSISLAGNLYARYAGC